MNFFKGKVERVASGEVHIAGPAIEAFVAPAAQGALHEGAALTVGVRPEHLTVGASGAFTAKGTVELVERLGESSFAYIRRADGQMLVAEMRGRVTPAPGETVSLGADLSDVHLFDDAGRRIEIVVE